MVEKLFCANKTLDESSIEAAMRQQYLLAKPEASLGKLEGIAIQLSGQQASVTPKVQSPFVTVFLSDHGIQVEDISENPPSMALNAIQQMEKGNAAFSVLAKQHQAQVDLVNVGLVTDVDASLPVTQSVIAKGTQHFVEHPAMTQSQMIDAIMVGVNAAEKAHSAGSDLFIAGEIAVGNTTSAIAMVSILSGKTPEELLSMGKTRLFRSEKRKADMINQAINQHQANLTSPLKVLQHLGGFETAAMCGAYLRCAQLGITILVDGLMASTAAWIADLVSRNDQLVECQSVEDMMLLGQYSVPETMFCICGDCPRLLEWCFFGHQSEIAAHALVLDILAREPLLTLEMKLGQATGALVALPILHQACLLHNEMAQNEAPDEIEVASESKCPIEW